MHLVQDDLEIWFPERRRDTEPDHLFEAASLIKNLCSSIENYVKDCGSRFERTQCKPTLVLHLRCPYPIIS